MITYFVGVGGGAGKALCAVRTVVRVGAIAKLKTF